MLYARILGFVTLLLRLLMMTAGPAAGATPLPADQAFQLRAQPDGEGGVELTWTIARGYYLYRDRITVTLGDERIRTLMEKGESKDDPTFGITEVYRGFATAIVPAELLPEQGRIVVSYQGCAENTICYPPVTKAIDLASLLIEDASLGSGGAGPTHVDTGDTSEVASWAPSSVAEVHTEPGRLAGSLASTVFGFLGFGLLLAFTPCIFPMVPILSGMLARAGEGLSVARGLALSSSYVLAMAAAYGIVGVFVAWTGENLQTVLQTPWAILTMSAVFLALALSMFGLYDLQLPQSWLPRFAPAGRKGSIGGAALLGFGSALVVGPCVTPPLAAALVFVAQTGDVLRGSLALFSLGLGMGLPLVAFGALGTRVLPRSGAWLAYVKIVFGFVFAGLAIWMASRVLSVAVAATAWGALFVAAGCCLVAPWGRTRARPWSAYAGAAAGILTLLYGSVLIIGSALSDYEPLRPMVWIGLVASTSDAGSADGFQVVSNEPDLDRAIDLGRRQGRGIMIDFSADWCTECRLMERDIFVRDVVRRQLRDMVLIRADLSHYDKSSKDLLQRFAVVGPPTIVFLRPDASEIADARVVGNIGLDGFLGKIAKANRI